MRAYKKRESYRQVVMVSYDTESLLGQLSTVLNISPSQLRSYVVHRGYSDGDIPISELTRVVSRTYIGHPRTKVEQITAPAKNILDSIAYETGIGMGVLLSVAVVRYTQQYLGRFPSLQPLYNTVYSQCIKGGF